MKAADSIRTLMPLLEQDPWREQEGFSPELEEFNRRLFASASDKPAAEFIINDWLQHHQPCLFGRIAARQSLLAYSVLTSDDLSQPDEHIRDEIQKARMLWTRSAFEGRKSGFIIAAISPELTYATPNRTLLKIARRLCSLYLLEDIEPDVIYLDEVFLEKPGPSRLTWRWSAGVNFFSAQGDLRWWHDHRFPGGIAFSVNSVGHMVKSGVIASAMRELNKSLGATDEDWESMKLDSLDKALVLARSSPLKSREKLGKSLSYLGLGKSRLTAM